jgi:hypothetical protein
MVAERDLTDPVRREASRTGHGNRRHPLCQEPEEVPPAALDRVAGSALADVIADVIADVQAVLRELWGEMDLSWHAAVLQQSGAPPYDT